LRLAGEAAKKLDQKKSAARWDQQAHELLSALTAVGDFAPSVSMLYAA
jgi:hypothetical protein